MEIRDHKGSLPLHWAATQCKSKSILDLMIKLYSKAAGMVDYAKNSPLCWACIWNNLVAAQILVISYPEAVSLKNNKGMTPFEALDEGRLNSISDESVIDVKNIFMKSTLHACVQEFCPANLYNYENLQVIIVIHPY